MNAEASSKLIPERRLGQFKLRADLLRDNVAGVLQLMGHVVVVQAVFDPADGCFAYVAYSEYFTPAEVGRTACHYQPLFSGNGRGRFLGFAGCRPVGSRREGDLAGGGGGIVAATATEGATS